MSDETLIRGVSHGRPGMFMKIIWGRVCMFEVITRVAVRKFVTIFS
jgi:hypothetical protein